MKETMQEEISSLQDTAIKEYHPDLYLNLMKQCVTDWIYLNPETDGVMSFLTTVKMFIFALRKGMNPIGMLHHFQSKQLVEKNRLEGYTPFPGRAHTMIGFKRLETLQFCIEDVLAKKVPGDLLEAGVWRGGACIFMRAILKAYGDQDRTVWVVDSFQGVPAPNRQKYPQDAGWWFHLFDEIAVPIESVKANFSRYELLDDQVKFLKGWFRDTLPNSRVEKLAIIRADGDLYESTMDVLSNLYPKLSVGGYVIIDDYGKIDACRQAVDDYRQAHGIHDKLIQSDFSEFYWQRSQ
ncbi:MAG: macrocin O-methyltransferase [Nodularia sp. (in: Bacteria)]|nr:MAG: macrocin O-methyltransferase [Nodularia sp. (in: cyanobacteria)]